MPVYVDLERCTACHACEVACRRLHNGHSNISLQVVRGRASLPLICHQCEKATCVMACSTGALAQEKDKVSFDPIKCNGCDMCILACSFGAISSDKLAYKCDLCSGEPACVATCPTQALVLNYEIAASRIRSRAAQVFRRRIR